MHHEAHHLFQLFISCVNFTHAFEACKTTLYLLAFLLIYILFTANQPQISLPLREHIFLAVVHESQLQQQQLMAAEMLMIYVTPSTKYQCIGQQCIVDLPVGRGMLTMFLVSMWFMPQLRMQMLRKAHAAIVAGLMCMSSRF